MDIAVTEYVAPREENPFIAWIGENLDAIEQQGSVTLSNVTADEKGKTVKAFRSAARENERTATLKRENENEDGSFELVFVLGAKRNHPGRAGNPKDDAVVETAKSKK